MSFFGSGSKKSAVKKSKLDIVNKDEITGHLFYLLFNSKPLRINVAGDSNDYSCKIAEIDDEKDLFYLTVLGRAPISKSDEIELRYDVSQLLYSIKTPCVKNSSDYDLCLSYPHIVEHFERRKHTRNVIRKSENIEVKLVTDLMGGYGGAGHIINIGIGGFGCLINKIVEVNSGKNIPMNPVIIKPGTIFAIVKFLLPSFGEFEVTGKSVHSSYAGGNLLCGASFVKLPTGKESAIEKFVSMKTSPITPPDFLAFFKKYKEEKEERENPKEEESKPAEKKLEEKKPEEKKPEEKKHPAPTEAPLHVVESDNNSHGAPHSAVESGAKQPAINNKVTEQPVATKPAIPEKISQSEMSHSGANPEAMIYKEPILLIFADNGDIGSVKKSLLSSGFSNYTLVGNYEEALKLMTEKEFKFIILDYNLSGKIKADQFIDIIKKHPKLNELPILVISEPLDISQKVRLINMKVSRVCFKPIKESNISETLIKILGAH